MYSPLVKICGISDVQTLQAAIAAGADFVGFVHFEKSPRHVDVQTLETLVKFVRDDGRQTESVVVLVNPDDSLLQTICENQKPDYLQLHGSETPERAAAIKQAFGVKIIKALSVSTAADISQAEAFRDIADIICFDAKAPKDSDNVGGFGISFDWALLHARTSLPETWMLSGGLSTANVAEALQQTHAPIVDVSSHVETPVGSGKKDVSKISAFIRAVHEAV